MTLKGGNFFLPIRQTRRNRSEHFGQVATQKAMPTMLSAIQWGCPQRRLRGGQSETVGMALGIKPPNVRVLLWRARQTAKRLGRLAFLLLNLRARIWLSTATGLRLIQKQPGVSSFKRRT